MLKFGLGAKCLPTHLPRRNIRGSWSGGILEELSPNMIGHGEDAGRNRCTIAAIFAT